MLPPLNSKAIILWHKWIRCHSKCIMARFNHIPVVTQKRFRCKSLLKQMISLLITSWIRILLKLLQENSFFKWILTTIREHTNSLRMKYCSTLKIITNSSRISKRCKTNNKSSNNKLLHSHLKLIQIWKRINLVIHPSSVPRINWKKDCQRV